MPFGDHELIHPVIHCFGRCTRCSRLIPLRSDSDGGPVIERLDCPHCGCTLSETAILTSYVEHALHTSAIASANKFIALDLAIIPFLISGLILVLVGYPFWFQLALQVGYLASLVTILRWFYYYWYRFRWVDEEYLEVLTRMRRLLLLWSSSVAVVWTAILIDNFVLN